MEVGAWGLSVHVGSVVNGVGSGNFLEGSRLLGSL